MTNKFDQKAKEFDEHPIIRETAVAFAQTIKKNRALKKHMDVLDIGCGSGLVAMNLYKQVRSLLMLDTSEEMLNILKNKMACHMISNMNVVHGDLNILDDHADSFDLIYMSNLLHHIEDIAGFFKTIIPLLKHKGHVCIGDLVKEEGAFHEDRSEVKHFGFQEQDLCDLLTEAGFEKCKSQRYHIIKKTDTTGRPKEYPLFFITANKPAPVQSARFAEYDLESQN